MSGKCLICGKQFCGESREYHALMCESKCKLRINMQARMKALVSELNGLRHSFTLEYGNDDTILADKELEKLYTEKEKELTALVDIQEYKINKLAEELEENRGNSRPEAPQSEVCRTESELYRSSVGE